MHKRKSEDGLTKVDFKKIYSHIIKKKFPERAAVSKEMFNKCELSRLDIIHLNEMIFGLPDKVTNSFNQKHRSYDKSTILEILKYQKVHQLNNTQLANYFKVSKNSITKWKKIFLH